MNSNDSEIADEMKAREEDPGELRTAFTALMEVKMAAARIRNYWPRRNKDDNSWDEQHDTRI